MTVLIHLVLLLMLALPCLAQSVVREHGRATDIRERLFAAEALRSENRAADAITLLEVLRTDNRLQDDPYLRSRTYFDLSRAYASVENFDMALEVLREAARIGSISYRDLAGEPDFALLREDRRFVELLDELTDRQRPWERLWRAPSGLKEREIELTEDLKVAGLSILWSEAKQNFVYFDRVPHLDWDSAYMAFLPKVRTAKGPVEYYQLLQQMCALLRDGHTAVDYPRSVRDSLLYRPAIDTRIVGETVLVERVQDAVLVADGILPGLEIVSIDGIPVHEYAQLYVIPYQSGSTLQDIRVRAYEYRLLSGPRSRSIAIEFRSQDGRKITRKVERTIAEEDLLWTRAPVASDTLVGNIGYLDLTTFHDEYMVKQVAERLASLANTDALIIDLRENGGGFTEVALQVLGLLMDSSFLTHSWETPRYSPFARFAGTPLQWDRHPAGEWPGTGAKAYRKPVVVLTSPRTYSAAEQFLVSFRQAGRGMIIGEATGGSTGHAVDLLLPGGGAVFFITTRDFFPDGRRFNGVGIVADVQVMPTVEDIRNGNDPVLATAIDRLLIQLGRSTDVPSVASLQHHISVPDWMPRTRQRSRPGSSSAMDPTRPGR